MVMSHPYCAVFSGVVREHMKELEEFNSQGSFQRNDVIYSVDDSADALYLILSGRVKIVRVSSTGSQKIIDIYQEGDFFGELCICGGGKREDQAIAMDGTSVTLFRVSGLLKLLPKKPKLALDLLLLLCARLSESQDQIATLAFDNIPRRLAQEILRRSRSVPGAQETAGRQLTIEITHEELAELVGASREIITTVMNQFRERGLVDYRRRTILVFPERVQEYLRESRS